MYNVPYFYIFLTSGFIKLNVIGLHISSVDGIFGLITSAFGGGGG